MFNISTMLRENGHDVKVFSMQHPDNLPSEEDRYFVSNVEYNTEHTLLEKAKLVIRTLYSSECRRKLRVLLEEVRPDIIHLHNYHHQLTPSILFACAQARIPVVMSTHDSKLVCPGYLLLNNGRTCEDCREGRFYNCVKLRCFKGSYGKSIVAAAESYLHHYVLKSYRHIKYYISPSRFLMDKMLDMGFRGNFLHLPYFVNTEMLEPHDDRGSAGMVYFGRLSAEKGLVCLLKAIKDLPVELNIIGKGPQEEELKSIIVEDKLSNVRLLRQLNGQELFDKVRESSFSVIPSECYDNSPNSILESFALGLPVIGAKIGGIPEIVRNKITGLTFEPGNVQDLKAKIIYMLNDPGETARMGKKAREAAEKEYNIADHYEKLQNIYERAIHS
jgi:glycosyltransferase involved in cell wall biosynthesis